MIVLIPEKIPAHNKGEEALFRGIMATLQSINPTKIYLYSKHPEYDVKVYGAECELLMESLIPDSEDPKSKKLIQVLYSLPLHFLFAIIFRLSPFVAQSLFRGKLWQVYREMDLGLAGHDSAFTIMHNLFVVFCKLMGKPVVIYGTSILPFLYERRWVRFLTKFCLNMTDLVTTREELSYKALIEKIGVCPDRIRLTADKAFILDPVDRDIAAGLLVKYGVEIGRRPLIGMTVVNKTGIFNTINVDFNYHLKVISEVVDWLVQEKGAHIVFFPHSIGPSEADDDRIAARAVYELCNCKESIALIEDDYSVAELKGMIGCCDFFIGERTHSVIGAVSMTVPAISISHPRDLRTIGILGMTVGIGDMIYNISELSVDSLLSFIRKGWSERERIHKHLSLVIPEVKKLVMQNGDYVQEVLRGRTVVN